MREISWSRGKYNQAVLGFMLVLFGYMLVVDFLVIRHQRAFLLADARNHVERDLEMMGTFMVDPLLEYDYVWVDQFLARWQREHPEVVLLRAVTPKGLEMFHYQGPAKAAGPTLQVSHRVAYLDQPLLTLELTVSSNAVEGMLRMLHIRLFLASFVLMIVAGVSLWFTLKRLAFVPLEREIEQRRSVERELHQARDRLEERVQERTAALEEANQRLLEEIQERQAAEERLASLHRQYKLILNSAGEGIYGIDQEGRIIFVNRAALAMLGYEEKELLGRHLHDFPQHVRWDGSPYPAGECPICASFDQPGGGRGSEYYFGRKDGTVFPVEYVSAPIEEQGEVTGTVVVFENITARKQAEHELLALTDTLEQRVRDRTAWLDEVNAELKDTLGQLEEMQGQLVETEKMAALGTLVAGVAHEINTPVGIGVTAASHLEKATRECAGRYRENRLTRKDLEGYLAACQDASGLILSNLQRAAELIRSFKQVAIDQSAETRRRFRIREYLEEVLLSLRPILKKTRLTVAIDCDENLEIVSYPGAFSQIITNFVTNSVTHGYGPGEEGRLRFEIRRRDNQLLFVYQDDGRGIEQENLAHIFEPFYTSNREKGGSGLGLHIVYNIVTQKLDGTIYCRSEPGNGARFVITLPLARGRGRNDA